jgi:predicted neutral ceramidase superfamily lipid hydrolase|tara:strand:- start:2840 stop:3343 length:504 start_codon:yes stop_codon:yes gene_type:complete
MRVKVMDIMESVKSRYNKIIKMKLSLKLRYFLFAIIVIGSIGVWLPFLLAALLDKKVELNSIPINLTTFYVSIYFAGCVDFILKKIDSVDHKTKSHAFNMVMLIVLSIVLIIATIWTSISKYIFIATLLAACGCVIALRLWWINNTENPNFNEIIRNEGMDIHGKKW